MWSVFCRRGLSLSLVATLFAPCAVEASAWTLLKNRQRLRLSFLFQQTSERYFLDGNRTPYFFDGENTTSGWFVEYARGLTDQLEIEAQLPVYRLSFNDFADDRTSNGFGDLRLTGRFSLDTNPVPASVYGTIKFPTGEFINDAEIVPVGEGQYDYELGIELGRSLWPRPGYVTGSLGYRFRTTNAETEIDFGNEILWRVEAGYKIVGRLHGKFLARGLYSQSSTSFGLEIPTLNREAIYIEPGLRFESTPGRGFEISFPTTVRGRNWPAGVVVNIGAYFDF